MLLLLSVKQTKMSMLSKKELLRRPLAFSLAVVLILVNLLVLAPPASAATLTNSYLRLNRMGTGTDSTMRVVFKTVGAGATSVVISMNGADTTTWTGQSGTVSTTQAVTGVSGCDASATALPGSITAAGSGNTITISSVTALSATTVYCADLTTSNSVHTPTTAGEFHPTITVGSDSTTVAVRVVTGSTGDQVVVNAVVPPTFNFAISGCASNIDNFTANLAAGSVTSTGGCTITVNTNAKTGWFAWARDSNTGLTSAAASKTIASTTPGTNATLSSGTEGYVLGVTSISQGTGAGTTSATNAYGNGSGGTAGAGQGSGLDSTLRLIASSNGTAASATLTTKEAAAISSLTPAATDYTDTVTFIGAGSF